MAHSVLFSSAFVLTILSILPIVASHDNGMDMSMDGAMSLSSGHMLPYFHFTPGDNLWFLGWVPKSAGAMVGTCIGLFLLGMVERWISACRAVMEVHWSKRAQIIQSDRLNARGLPVSSESRPDLKKRESSSSYPTSVEIRDAAIIKGAPPFIFVHDATRGIFHVAQSALQFAFMLVAMTFQLGFIFALVVGLGVGETLFGRYASHAAHLA